MKKWLKRIKNEKGLTLIELLAVVVILGIIAAIAVPSISNIIDNSKKDAHVSNALMIINATKLAVASNDQTTLADDNITITELVDGGYLAAIPKDPDTEDSYQVEKDGVTITKDNNINVYKVNLTGEKFKIAGKTESELNNDGRKNVVPN